MIENTQQKITEITEAMRDLLLYKNQKYGDSALKPKQIFYKGGATDSTLCLISSLDLQIV